MGELEDAWERALGLIERAAEFGRLDEKGGTIFGWYPAKPGEDPLADARVAWLRHAAYDPLTERELGKLERELGRPLPDALRRFYTACANGVDLLGEDVSVYGFRRGWMLDPFELVVEAADPPAGATASHVFFGSWGDSNHPLYLDADDDRVHLSGLNSVRPLRTWPGLGTCVSCCPRRRTHSRSTPGSSCWSSRTRSATCRSATASTRTAVT